MITKKIVKGINRIRTHIMHRCTLGHYPPGYTTSWLPVCK